MFETSKDLLNIAIAVSVVGFTVFVCWAIYYFAMILRQGFKIFREMRSRLHKIDEVIKTLKEKIEHSTSYLLLIGEGVKKLVEVAKNYTGSQENKKAK
ncbi:hypothetical protein DRH27_03960, partial [Candidatus Falkowbacteria bacterium]